MKKTNQKVKTILAYWTYVIIMAIASIFSSLLAIRSIIHYIIPIFVVIGFVITYFIVRKCTIKTLGSSEGLSLRLL